MCGFEWAYGRGDARLENGKRDDDIGMGIGRREVNEVFVRWVRRWKSARCGNGKYTEKWIRGIRSKHVGDQGAEKVQGMKRDMDGTV